MLLDVWGDRFEPGDCLHVFGLSRAALELAEIARYRGTSVVVSPILWYHLRSLCGAEPCWSRKARLTAGFMARLLRVRPRDWKQQLLTHAERVLPNSRAEAKQLMRYFGVPPEKLRVVPNGVDTTWLDRARPPGGSEPERDIILCVGRIEPRKNQLTVIRAARALGLPLVVVGAPLPNHAAYYEACRAAAGSEVQFLGPLPHRGPALAKLFWRARAVVLASWYETPGLAALEGAAAGANVVVTRFGTATDYFGEFAYYVHPGSVRSVRDALWQAWNIAPPQELMIRVRTRFRWARIGRELARVYEELRQRPVATNQAA